MNQGYIKLWRKSLDAGWIKNHKLWAFWTYCLLKTSYKEYDAIVGLQVIHLMPGQFIFGLKKASSDTGLTIRQIRTTLAFLIKAGNLTIKTTNKFSIITIINWSTYQQEEVEHDKQNDKPLANKGQHTRIKRSSFINKRTPEKILSEISELEKRYSDQETINQAFQAISSTRKSNKIADSVKLSILQAWEKHPVLSITTAIKTYLEKEYHHQGKDEKYLLGIIRNFNPEARMINGQALKSTGSPLLDDYYRSQGEKFI